MTEPIHRDLVRSYWESYEEHCVPREAGPEQRTETRRAFYAGALFTIMVLDRIGEPDVPEREGLEIMSMLRAECEEFVAEQLEGEGHR